MKETPVERYSVEIGAILFCREGDIVEANQQLAKWDPSNMPIIAEDGGVVDLLDLLDGVTYKRDQRRGSMEQLTVLEHNDDLSPRIVIKNPQTLEDIREYPLAAGTLLMVKKGQRVSPGTTLARIPYQQQRNKDITGGLPRVAELFEARTPKDIAAYKTKKGRVVYVTNPDTEETSEHHIPNNKHLIVSNGETSRRARSSPRAP